MIKHFILASLGNINPFKGLNQKQYGQLLRISHFQHLTEDLASRKVLLVVSQKMLNYSL